MREQVCIYMCPWPRIQTAMLDEKSLIVTYKDWRGEPRGSLKKSQRDPEHFGDCIDCNQCVAVCPTGIDIREGPQIGCITCALCIDACDRVMKDIGRPRGLIDYATLEGCRAEALGEPPQSAWKALLRPRTIPAPPRPLSSEVLAHFHHQNYSLTFFFLRQEQELVIL